jgi:hypothetical protein
VLHLTVEGAVRHAPDRLAEGDVTWNRLPDLMAEAFAAVVDVGKAIAAALSGRYAAHVRDLSSSGECPAGFARQTRPGIFFAGSRHRRRLNQCLRVGEYLLRSPRIATA